MGSPGPRFLNAIAWISTPLDLDKFKAEVLAPIEQALGRVRTADKNAPRTIDLDVIVFDERVLDNNLWQRDFIVLPLAELRPVPPTKRVWPKLLSACALPLLPLCAPIYVI